MHCWELRESGVKKGLRVEPGNDPLVNITEDEEFYVSIDPKLASLVEKASKFHPVRINALRREGSNEFFSPTKPTDNALVLVNLRDPYGGKIALTAANDRGEVLASNRVVRSFGPFPSTGIEIEGHAYGAEKPWEQGAKHLEMLLTMVPGASFRILRTKTMWESFVRWDGRELRVGSVAGHDKAPRQDKPRTTSSFATLGDVIRLPS